jgi:hypothetical protein
MSNSYIQERDELLKEMTTLSSLLHGSWLERYSTCTRPDCACHSGKRHGPRYYLVINDNGQQRQKYIPNSLVKKAQTGLAQHKRLQQIVDRITQINLILMKERNHESE